MKELLYCAILILLFYILYIDKSVENLVLIAVSLCILIVYAFNFKILKTEHFITSSSADMYIDPTFKETMYPKMNQDLAYYVSSFDKDYIDFKNSALINVMNDRLGALLGEDLRNFSFDIYNQFDGIKITQEIRLTHASNVFESFDTFSIFWYMKLGTHKTLFQNETDTPISIIKFEHDNLRISEFDLLKINLVFKRGHLNPSVVLHVANQTISNSYTYTIDDYYENKIFADKKFHLFTFVKESGKYHFYVDDYVLFECVEDDCINARLFDLHPDSTTVKIRDSPILIKSDRDVSVPLYINAFGIYRNRALSFDDVKELNLYYINIKRHMSPHYYALLEEKKALESRLDRFTKTCPFSQETVCSSSACHTIIDWNNTNELIGNTDCLKQVVEYCNGLSNLDDDMICRFLKTDSIFQIASKLDSNLFMYNPNNVGNLEESTNIAVLEKLDKLGLKNIYLDKSYRDTQGKYSGEMNRLINDLLTTNQTINIDTLNSLYDSKIDSRVTNDIDYDNLYTNSRSNLDYTNLYNDILAQTTNVSTNQKNAETTTTVPIPDELNTDLIDLDYDDMAQPNIYEHVLKKHREDQIDKELESSSWNFLNRWF